MSKNGGPSQIERAMKNARQTLTVLSETVGLSDVTQVNIEIIKGMMWRMTVSRGDGTNTQYGNTL